MKTKKLLISLGIGIIATVVMAGISKAGLQSRPNATSLTNRTANDFFTLIRNMEASGGVLGLNATIDGTTFLDSSNNGLDIHMAKNTEWGTAAMLAASSYGADPSGSSYASTTGNATGIYKMDDNVDEYVAGIWDKSNSYMSKIRTADSRYYDLYSSATAKAGDATWETKYWKDAKVAGSVSASHPVFVRSYEALFGFTSDSGYGYSRDGSRAVVVCRWRTLKIYCPLLFKMYKNRQLDLRKANAQLQSWIGHASHTTSGGLIQDVKSKYDWLYKENQ